MENNNSQSPKEYKINITTTIRSSLKDLADANEINYNFALEFGIKFILAEKFLIDYPENKLTKAIERYQKLLSSNPDAEEITKLDTDPKNELPQV